MNDEILEKVLASPRLPSLPTIALEVIELVQQRDVDIRQIAETISHDPALTTKILKTVNSSFYSQTQEISTVTHALVILGLNSIKTLALGFSLVNNLPKGEEGEGGFDHMSFWKRSLYTAVAARCLSTTCGVIEQEEAFLGGLLQDLGLLAMAETLDDDYLDLVEDAENDHAKLISLEREQLDTDHAEIGSAIAEQWKLPALLVNPIRFHEDPTEAPEELAPLCRAVALGNKAADVFILEENSGAALEQYFNLAETWFNLSREMAEPLLSTIHKNTVEMGRLFDLPTGPLGNPQEIIARAHEALLNVSMQQNQESVQLEKQNESLQKKATTDPLTQIANRGHYNDYSAEQFDACRKSNQPLSILFLDTDHFKNFNDTHGHAVGDRVLIAKANMLKNTVGDQGFVARYGGEEFSVVMPGADRVAAAKMAEAIRLAIQAMPVESDEGEPLSVTVSIGVATDDGTFFKSIEQLIKAADQGVYAAKDGGRNCVRVFTPRVKAPAA